MYDASKNETLSIQILKSGFLARLDQNLQVTQAALLLPIRSKLDLPTQFPSRPSAYVIYSYISLTCSCQREIISFWNN